MSITTRISESQFTCHVNASGSVCDLLLDELDDMIIRVLRSWLFPHFQYSTTAAPTPVGLVDNEMRSQ